MRAAAAPAPAVVPSLWGQVAAPRRVAAPEPVATPGAIAAPEPVATPGAIAAPEPRMALPEGAAEGREGTAGAHPRRTTQPTRALVTTRATAVCSIAARLPSSTPRRPSPMPAMPDCDRQTVGTRDRSVALARPFCPS